jgi:hypothetical protein
MVDLSIAMLVYQRVSTIHSWKKPIPEIFRLIPDFDRFRGGLEATLLGLECDVFKV